MIERCIRRVHRVPRVVSALHYVRHGSRSTLGAETPHEARSRPPQAQGAIPRSASGARGPVLHAAAILRAGARRPLTRRSTAVSLCCDSDTGYSSVAIFVHIFTPLIAVYVLSYYTYRTNHVLFFFRHATQLSSFFLFTLE